MCEQWGGGGCCVVLTMTTTCRDQEEKGGRARGEGKDNYSMMLAETINKGRCGEGGEAERIL